jgi:hypothetical protein
MCNQVKSPIFILVSGVRPIINGKHVCQCGFLNIAFFNADGGEVEQCNGAQIALPWKFSEKA